MYYEKNRNTNAKLIPAENVKMHNCRALINYRLLLKSSKHGSNIEQLSFWH